MLKIHCGFLFDIDFSIVVSKYIIILMYFEIRIKILYEFVHVKNCLRYFWINLSVSKITL